MTTEEIKKIANEIRIDVVKMLNAAGSGHSGGSLGMADVMSVLYFGGILQYKADDPGWDERDRLILSNGHICPVLYATMAQVGFFDQEELLSLRQLGSRLQGHPHRTSLPGLETTSGPLGSGLAQGIGMALGLRHEGKSNRVFVLCSDGEHNEGNHWEAVMLAGKYKLTNLMAITDRNNVQIDGYTDDVMPLEPLADKYHAFGWEVVEIDGHNHNQILETIKFGLEKVEKPLMVLAHTTLGKGVSFMENKPEWHGKAPNDDELERALGELEGRALR